MKKILATLLAAAMLLSLAVTAVAYDDYQAPAPLAVDLELQAQGRALITETLDVFNTGSFHLRGTTVLPTTLDHLFDPLPGQTAAIVMAANADQMVFEQTISFSSMLGNVRGFFFRLFFGNRMRMVVEDDDVRIIFPNRRLFFSVAELAELTGDDFPVLDLADLDFSGLGDLVVPADLHVERAGNYIRVTLENAEDGYTHFFYRSGLLRRIVTELPDDSISIILVDSFSANPPARLFSTSWMLRFPLGWLLRMSNA